MFHDPPGKLPRRVPGGVDEHTVQLVGLEAHDLSHRVEQQLFLEHHKDFLALIVCRRAVDQAVIDAIPKFFPAVGVADHLRFQVEHIKHQLNDDLPHGLAFFLGEQVIPGADPIPRDGLVFGEGVADEPPCADAQEMIHRLQGIVRLFQLQLQGREGVLPKAPMDGPVVFKPLVADGLHVSFLVLKVPHGVALEVFDTLLGDPLAVLLLLPERE